MLLKKAGDEGWSNVPLVNRYSENLRGIGISDMANAILYGSDHRATGARGRHVFQVMDAICQSSLEKKHFTL